MGTINTDSRNVNKPSITTNILPQLHNAFGGNMVPYIKVSKLSSTTTHEEEINGESPLYLTSIPIQEQVMKIFFSLDPSSQTSIDLNPLLEVLNSEQKFGVVDFILDLNGSIDTNSGEAIPYNNINDPYIFGNNHNLRFSNFAPYNALSILNHNAQDFKFSTDYNLGFQFILEGFDAPEADTDSYERHHVILSNGGKTYSVVEDRESETYNHIFNSQDLSNSYSSDFGSSLISPLHKESNDGTTENITNSYGGSTIASWDKNRNISYTGDYFSADESVDLGNGIVTKLIFRVVFSSNCEIITNTSLTNLPSLKIGNIMLGSHLEFPIAPEIGFTKDIENDGVNTKDSISGGVLHDIKYTQPAFIIDYGNDYGFYEGTESLEMARFGNNRFQNKFTGRKGRRLFELDIEGILDTDLFPVLESPKVGADKYNDDLQDLSTLQSNLSASGNNNKRTLYQSLIYETMTGTIPFIFCENVNDLNTYDCVRQDKLTYSMLDANSISIDNIAPDYYSLSLKIREVW